MHDPAPRRSVDRDVEALAIVAEVRANSCRRQAKLVQRIDMLAVLALRVLGKQFAHCGLRYSRERFVEVGIELADLTDRITQLLCILDVIDRFLTVPIAKSVLTGDHVIERVDHLIGDLTQIHLHC